MKDNRIASAIDLAIQKYDTPAGSLFVAARHGRTKKMLHARYGDSLSGVLYDFRSILSLRFRAA